MVARKYIVIIQARTNSSRLPGKCFLPLAEEILTVLCAKRVSNFSSEIWVATSTEPVDDLLAERLQRAGIKVFRGELNNVLSRFVALCLKRKINRDDVVIRLTADNPLVDDSFLERMKNIWEQNEFDYFCAHPLGGSKKKWPVGLSAEFFYASTIYDLVDKNPTFADQEHVTPTIKLNATNSASMSDFCDYEPNYQRSYSIDTLADYIFVSSIFEKVGRFASVEEIISANLEEPGENYLPLES